MGVESDTPHLLPLLPPDLHLCPCTQGADLASCVRRSCREPEDLAEKEGDSGLDNFVFFITSLCILGKSLSLPGPQFPFLTQTAFLVQMAPEVTHSLLLGLQNHATQALDPCFDSPCPWRTAQGHFSSRKGSRAPSLGKTPAPWSTHHRSQIPQVKAAFAVALASVPKPSARVINDSCSPASLPAAT